jgi:hypothetical protein
MSQSVGTFTLFCSFDVEQECRHVWQAVETVFVRQVDPSRASPEALMATFADGIDARDEKTVLACFGVGPILSPLDPGPIWVRRMLAVLRLRDAMETRFGREATNRALTEPWLQAPDTQRLRAARWIVEGGAARQKNDQTVNWFFQTNGLGVGWRSWERQGWRVGMGVPASGDTTRRMNEQLQREADLARKLSEAVKAGQYRSAEDVGKALSSMERATAATDKGIHPPPQTQQE